MMARILTIAFVATAAGTDCTTGECSDIDDVSLLQTDIKKHNHVKDLGNSSRPDIAQKILGQYNCLSKCDVEKYRDAFTAKQLDPNGPGAAEQQAIDNPALCTLLGGWFSGDGCGAKCDGLSKASNLLACCPMPQRPTSLVESNASTWQPPLCLAKCGDLSRGPPPCGEMTQMLAGCGVSCDDKMKTQLDKMACRKQHVSRCAASASDLNKVKKECCKLLD